jgi:8-oxo-dGTP pyrophosphatase MutT (NUDIX family)
LDVKTLSCGAVIVRRTANGWLTLMLRAYSNWDSPKGIREEGETPMQAAIREVSEEAGIDQLDFTWGDRTMDTGPYGDGKVARYHLAQTQQKDIVMGISPETGQPEHEEYRWVDFDTAHDLASPRVRSVLQWARQVIGA